MISELTAIQGRWEDTLNISPHTSNTIKLSVLVWVIHDSPSLQINKRCKVQERALLVTDSVIFKLDPRKHYQRKKTPLDLNHVTGMSVSPSLDQGFAIHFQNGKDLLCYMVNPHNENRVAELVAVLCQICHR